MTVRLRVAGVGFVSFSLCPNMHVDRSRYELRPLHLDRAHRVLSRHGTMSPRYLMQGHVTIVF